MGVDKRLVHVRDAAAPTRVDLISARRYTRTSVRTERPVEATPYPPESRHDTPKPGFQSQARFLPHGSGRVNECPQHECPQQRADANIPTRPRHHRGIDQPTRIRENCGMDILRRGNERSIWSQFGSRYWSNDFDSPSVPTTWPPGEPNGPPVRTFAPAVVPACVSSNVDWSAYPSSTIQRET